MMNPIKKEKLEVKLDTNIISRTQESTSYYLGSWLYSPSDCLLPRLEGKLNCHLDVAIPSIYLSQRNPNVQRRCIWGAELYTDDSDAVAMLMHSGRVVVPDFEHFPQDILVTFCVYPNLMEYPSIETEAITSRRWLNHDGMSLRIHGVKFLSAGEAIKIVGRKNRKRLLRNFIDVYQQQIVNPKTRNVMDNTIIFDEFMDPCLRYTTKIRDYLQNRSFEIKYEDTVHQLLFEKTYTLVMKKPMQKQIQHDIEWKEIVFCERGIKIGGDERESIHGSASESEEKYYFLAKYIKML